MASTTNILSLALVLWLSLLSDWTPGAKGHETSCRKKSLFFELTEEYGNYVIYFLEAMALAYTIGLKVEPTWRRACVARLYSEF